MARTDEDTLAQIMTVFRSFDTRGDGTMGKDDLRQVLRNLRQGVQLGEGEIDALFGASEQVAGERIHIEAWLREVFMSRDAAVAAPAPSDSECDIVSAGPSKRKIVGPFVVNTSACTGKSAKDLFSAVAAEMGWRERDLEARPVNGAARQKAKKPTIYCVMNTIDLLDRLDTLGRSSWISRYMGMPDLCDKGNFARMVLACSHLAGGDDESWQFLPKTWVLPDQMDELRAKLGNSKKTYIVKPEDGSQGDGIFLVQGVRDLDLKMSTKPSKAAVVQRYIEKPLLLQGTKFDFRLYVAVVGGSVDSAPVAFLCREGLGRFCTEVYNEPTAKNMHNCMGHLTNYSLNKRSDKFEHSGESMAEVMDDASCASKRPLSVTLRQIAAEHPEFDAEEFFEQCSELVRKTVAIYAPILSSFGRGIPGPAGPFRSFQILGFDVMLDHRFKPYLLEVNNSPSLCIDEALPLEGDLAADGHRARGRRERDGVCRCMDMAQPHTHRESLVDLHVKKTAMCGTFRILEQIHRGEEPDVDDFIALNVGDDDLYASLAPFESLFYRAGGAPKAFMSSTLRRTLGGVCGNGTLEKHDLDSLSQRFRFTQYVNNDRAQKPEPLRLFEYMELLKQVGARAFPGMPVGEAVGRVLMAANI